MNWTCGAKRALGVAMLSLVISSCSVDGGADLTGGESSRLCFRNTYGEREGERDRQQLIVAIDGDRATGSYDWLPAFKDKRRGTFKGDFSDGVVRGDYTFLQEGKRETVSIAITITEDAALVSGGPPELGLKASIQRVACD